MIFSLYSRLKIRIGQDEEHIFDRGRLMFTEVAEIEKVTGLSYGEWEQALARYSISAVGALLHVLRKRDGIADDYATMQFNAAELDVVPLHEDDTEFTAAQVAADLARRAAEAKAEGPTPAAAGAAAPEGASPATTPTSPASPNGTTSAPGNGTASPGMTSASSRPTLTSA